MAPQETKIVPSAGLRRAAWSVWAPSTAAIHPKLMVFPVMALWWWALLAMALLEALPAPSAGPKQAAWSVSAPSTAAISPGVMVLPVMVRWWWAPPTMEPQETKLVPSAGLRLAVWPVWAPSTAAISPGVMVYPVMALWWWALLAMALLEALPAPSAGLRQLAWKKWRTGYVMQASLYRLTSRSWLEPPTPMVAWWSEHLTTIRRLSPALQLWGVASSRSLTCKRAFPEQPEDPT